MALGAFVHRARAWSIEMFQDSVLNDLGSTSSFSMTVLKISLTDDGNSMGLGLHIMKVVECVCMVTCVGRITLDDQSQSISEGELESVFVHLVVGFNGRAVGRVAEWRGHDDKCGDVALKLRREAEGIGHGDQGGGALQIGRVC